MLELSMRLLILRVLLSIFRLRRLKHSVCIFTIAYSMIIIVTILVLGPHFA